MRLKRWQSENKLLADQAPEGCHAGAQVNKVNAQVDLHVRFSLDCSIAACSHRRPV
jgi:hypothetical protein